MVQSGVAGAALVVEDVGQARCDARGLVTGDCVRTSKTDSDVVPALEQPFVGHGIEHERSVPSSVGYLDREALHVDDQEARHCVPCPPPPGTRRAWVREASTTPRGHPVSGPSTESPSTSTTRSLDGSS